MLRRFAAFVGDDAGGRGSALEFAGLAADFGGGAEGFLLARFFPGTFAGHGNDQDVEKSHNEFSGRSAKAARWPTAVWYFIFLLHDSGGVAPGYHIQPLRGWGIVSAPSAG